MKRIIVVALATLLVAPVGLAYASFLSKSIGIEPDSSKLIVQQVPESFTPQVLAMGFSRVERVRLAESEARTYRVVIPTGYSVANAIDALRGAFPNAFIDMDGWVN